MPLQPEGGIRRSRDQRAVLRVLVIHNAFDCREVVERAEEILNKLNHDN